jgi:hypothetical protein
MRIRFARAEHDERIGEQRHQAVGVGATDRLIDLGDETLRVFLGFAFVDRLLLRLLDGLFATTARRREQQRGERET